jgi:hypothetical protein
MVPCGRIGMIRGCQTENGEEGTTILNFSLHQRRLKKLA